MKYEDLLSFLQHVGTDPSRLIFEDELTGIHNRRFLKSYLQHKVPWDSLESRPVSLLMMDLDYFKKINDTHGHDAGDEALIWVAKLFKEASGDQGMPIRYAGDEFMILIMGADKKAALQVGEQLIQRTHEESLHLEEKDIDLNITLSIGVASAPDDAKGPKDLIKKADIALYSAKKSGRDQVADAGQIAPQQVISKEAAQKLDKATLAGRKALFAEVVKALKKFSKRQSQFLIIEGADGMGKSEFLRGIRQNLAKSKIWKIGLDGAPQEAFRPYYMTTNILIEILNQLPDKGKGIIEDLTPREDNYLSYILPQLGEPEDLSHQEDEETLREQIFTTLIHFILKLIDSQALILLIDDLHYSDDATLLLLRRLMLRKDIPLFICGTAANIHPDKVKGKKTPLEQFISTYQKELNINRLKLSPLSAADVTSHFQRIFPKISLPENFEKDLMQITHGNPLFISEIQRKLVQDEKVTLAGQQWVIKPLEEGYLPKSLEEIVSQKITSLDEESRQLLEHASAFGEKVSLSMLTGSSESKEIQVQEFIDYAVSEGLISSDFQMNDDTIRFLSNRVLDITYGAINDDRKKELHEQIGTYHETLHEQRLLPSAAALAYHFQLSANREKAQLYQESLQTHSNKIFNTEEAINYTGEKLPDDVSEDIPLDPASLAHIPVVIRTLLTTVRNIKLYPPGSKATVKATQQLKETIDKVLADNERLNIMIVENAIVANGEQLDITKFKSVGDAFMKFLGRLELSGIAFSRGIGENELMVMLESLSMVSRKIIDRRFWQRFSREQRLLHIDLKQVRYTTMEGAEETREDQEMPLKGDKDVPIRDSAKLLDQDQELDEQDYAQIPQVIRSLITAASNIRLYPPGSKGVKNSIEALQKALDGFLLRRPALTLAQVGEALLVNGASVDTSDFKGIANGFLKLLGKIGLSSLTFLKEVSTRELKSFITALGRTKADELNSEFWQRFAEKQKFSGIFFDQALYEILEHQASIDSEREEPVEESVAEEPEDEETISEVPLEDEDRQTEAFLESIAQQLDDLVLKGDVKKAKKLINLLFKGFADKAPQTRLQVIRLCDNLLKDLDLASQPQFVEMLTDPLLLILVEEKSLDLLKEMGILLSRTASNFIQFDDYQRANRILKHLQKRRQQLQDNKDEQIQPQEIIFIQDLDQKIQGILLDDLKSQDPSRMQQTARLLGNLGSVALPVLIEVIKKEDNLRLRQIASHLLGKLGSEAAKILKSELVIEGFVEERVRILEVIDNVTKDLKTELAYTIGERNIKVRKAALRLAERLNDEEVTLLLLDYANHEDIGLAMVAIESLGKLKSAGAVDGLVSLLESTKETERLVACCKALGRIADPGGIEPLAKIIAPVSFLSLRKKQSSIARATAAFALTQISHPRAAEVLDLYVEDRDPRVRRAALKKMNTPKPSSPVKED